MRYNPKIILAFYKECGLPAPELEFRFCPTRRWRFDLAWVKERVALEVQGGIFSGGAHVRGAHLVAEHEKLNTAAALGWRILYCQPQDVATVDMVGCIKMVLRYGKSG